MMTNMVESFHFKEIPFQHLNGSLKARVASQSMSEAIFYIELNLILSYVN